MKQLKTEMSSCPAVEDVASKRKGFVADCLLKVSCSSDGGADVGKLKVSSIYMYMGMCTEMM